MTHDKSDATLGLVACPYCFALVRLIDISLHKGWHGRIGDLR